MLKSVLAFLRARATERSSIVQFAVLLLVLAVLFDFISVDQIDGATGKILAALAFAGPLVGILSPDARLGGNATAAALAAAEEAAAARVPGADRVKQDVNAVADSVASLEAEIPAGLGAAVLAGAGVAAPVPAAPASVPAAS